MSEPSTRTEADLVEFIRSSDLRAPDELHRKVESLIAARLSSPARSASSSRSRLRFGLGFAGTIALAAVVAIAVAAGLSGGGARLTLHQTAALTLRGATQPAPTESKRHDGQLTAAVDGIAFPYWEDRFGWRSTGERSDQIHGRAITTVFYEDGRGRRIGYSIVADTPAPSLSGGHVAMRGTVPYRVFTQDGAQAITWLRDGRLCVVSGRGVNSATLLKLASWTDGGAVPT